MAHLITVGSLAFKENNLIHIQLYWMPSISRDAEKIKSTWHKIPRTESAIARILSNSSISFVHWIKGIKKFGIEAETKNAV